MNPISSPFFSGSGMLEVREESLVTSMPENVPWQCRYEAAILELDPANLRDKVALAKSAMQQRLEDLNRAPDAGSTKEQRTLAHALMILRVLERVELKARLAARSQTGLDVAGGGAL
jgi:hypothetical protein